MSRSLTHHQLPHPLFSRSCPHERRNMRSVWPKSGELRVFKSDNGSRWTPNQQDKHLADTTIDGVSWSLTDHLGTVRDILGSENVHLIYDSFGNLISGTNPLLFGFTGKAFDSDTHLQNNINRWYDATVGRWLSTDPIGFEGNDMNLYRYVKNKVFLFVDSFGYEPSTTIETITVFGRIPGNPDPKSKDITTRFTLTITTSSECGGDSGTDPSITMGCDDMKTWTMRNLEWGGVDIGIASVDMTFHFTQKVNVTTVDRPDGQSGKISYATLYVKIYSIFTIGVGLKIPYPPIGGHATVHTERQEHGTFTFKRKIECCSTCDQ